MPLTLKGEQTDPEEPWAAGRTVWFRILISFLFGHADEHMKLGLQDDSDAYSHYQ